MQIKKKLPITIIIIITVPLLLSSILLYAFSRKEILDNANTKLYAIASVESKSLKKLIDSKIGDNEIFSNSNSIIRLLKYFNKYNVTTEEYRQAYNDISSLLNKWMIESSDVDNIFVINQDGIIISSGNPNYLNINMSNKSYFKDAIKGKAVVSDIIISSFHNEKVVVFADPIYDENKNIIGVLASDMSLNYFKNFVADVKIGNKGYGFLLDSDGTVLYHPDKSILGKKVMSKGIQSLVTRINNGEKVEDKLNLYVYNGIPKYLGYSVIPELNWILIISQESSEVTKIIDSELFINLIITLFFVFIAALIAIKISQGVTIPIYNLIKVMKKAESGDITSFSEIKTKDEFGQLSVSFNSMIFKLNSSYEELSSVYEELYAVEEDLQGKYKELLLSEDSYKRLEEKYSIALDSANDVIWDWDLNTGDFFTSDRWSDLTGYPQIHKMDFDFAIMLGVPSEEIALIKKTFKAEDDKFKDYFRIEFKLIKEDGNFLWVLLKGKVIKNINDSTIKLTGSLIDISEAKAYREQIEFMAYYDALTKLSNRALFEKNLKCELENDNQQGAVLFIDLDDFKNINDTLGHSYGDKYLIEIAKRLRDITTSLDLVTRFGGDEFLILKPKVTSKETLTAFADTIIEIFNNAFDIEGYQVYSTASVGIVFYPEQGKNMSEILKKADTAMYKAKSLGKNRYAFFDESLTELVDRKSKITTILRNAIQNNEVFLNYQPKYDAKTKRVVGFEALMRLNNEEMGFISPAEFIPIAEESTMIIELGEWCLRKACEKNSQLRSLGYIYEDIAVNMSAIQLQQPNFLTMIKNVISEYNLKPEALEIEITESVLIRSMEHFITVFKELKELGVRIALDDFGTGYSSLSYLRLFPINTVKLDKSFIDEVYNDKNQRALVGEIIKMTHLLNIELVAEGVEDQNQLDVLVEMDCDKIQGYLLSKPLPENMLIEILNKEI